MTTETVWDVVHRVAREDPRVVFIGSDLNPTLLSDMRSGLPDQFMMEGIQEQHLIGMAAGMALEGARPIVSTIATFLTRRCFEQVLIDVGLHRTPVVMLGTGAGLAYHFFGPTHCAVDDFALLRTVPGIVLVSPGSMSEAATLLEEALRSGRFLYMRVPRFDQTPVPEGLAKPRIGVPIEMRGGRDVVILSSGALTPNAIAAAEEVEKDGLSVGVLHVHTVKPMDTAAVLDSVAGVEVVITLEEHLRDGGLGTEVLHLLADSQTADLPMPRVVRLGLADRYVPGYGSWAEAVEAAGLDARSVADVLRGIRVAALSGGK